VPYAGYVFLAIQDRTMRVLLIGIPAGIIALASLAQLVRGLRRRPGQPATGAVPKPTVPVGG
jgi:signal peptidase